MGLFVFEKTAAVYVQYVDTGILNSNKTRETERHKNNRLQTGGFNALRARVTAMI